MNQQLFIHKFQPLYFNDFQENPTVELIKTLFEMNNLNILLVGNMDSGKTTILNAIIREYYKSYTTTQYTENVLYINNLKEQGINYYRNDVKIFCQTSSCITGKKKFVVLDDFDLINEQSQQVFRNCIDKYSHNVYFIASCTNNQKVIESIQSRFIIIKNNTFTKQFLKQMVNNIKHIENIDIDDETIDFIINISNNTIKTLINYMEKFKLINKKITINVAKQSCSNINFSIFETYTTHIINKQLNDAIQIMYSLHDTGYSVIDILDNYFVFIKNTNIINENEKYNIFPIICKYITIFNNVHEDEIELVLFTNNLINCI